MLCINFWFDNCFNPEIIVLFNLGQTWRFTFLAPTLMPLLSFSFQTVMCVCFVEHCCCLHFWAHLWSVVVLEPLPLRLSSFCVLRRADCVLTFSSWRALSDCSAVTHPVPSSSARWESGASDWRVCYCAGSAACCCLFPTIPRASRITGYENPSWSPGRLNPPTQVLQRRTKSSEYSVFSHSPASKSLSFLISSLRTSLCSLLTLPF